MGVRVEHHRGAEGGELSWMGAQSVQALEEGGGGRGFDCIPAFWVHRRTQNFTPAKDGERQRARGRGSGVPKEVPEPN